MIDLLEMPDRFNRMLLLISSRQTAGIDKRSAPFTSKRRRPYGHYIRVYFCRQTSTPCPGARVRTCFLCPWRIFPSLSYFSIVSKTYDRIRCSTIVACGLWSLNLGFQILLRNTTLSLRRYHKTSQEPISSVQYIF